MTRQTDRQSDDEGGRQTYRQTARDREKDRCRYVDRLKTHRHANSHLVSNKERGGEGRERE